jgi:alpha-mannosidase
VQQVAEGQARRSLRALARRVPPAPEGSVRFLVVNPDIHAFSGRVDVTIDLPVESAESGRLLDSDLFDAPLAFFPRGSSILAVRDPEGRPVPFQEVGREAREEQWTSRVDLPLAVHVDRVHLVCDLSLPSAGFVAFDAQVGVNAAGLPAQGSEGRTIENDLLRIEVNADGSLSVLDRLTGVVYRNVLEIEDGGDVGDEYTYSPPAADRRVTSRGLAKAVVSVRSVGPLRSSLHIDATLEVPRAANPDRAGRSAETSLVRFGLDLELTQGSPVVSCRVKVENHASDHRLRLLFPTGTRAVSQSRADTAFGVVSRSAQRIVPSSPPPEAPVNTAPLQSFVDAGDARVGMTVLSEGLMEYEVLAAESESEVARIALTVLRSVGWLSRDDLRTRQGNAGPSLQTPGAQCLAAYDFRFAFVPRAEPPTAGALCDLGRRFLAPPKVVVGTNGPRTGSPLPRRHSFLSVACEPARAVSLSALKKADERDFVVLRVFNPGAVAVQMTISRDCEIGAAFLTDLREQRQEAVAPGDGGITVIAGPGKIVTLDLGGRVSTSGAL